MRGLVCATALLVMPGVAVGQSTSTPPRIAFVAAAHAPAVAGRVEAFREGLRARGLIEGRTINVEYHYGEERADRLQAIVTDLVKRNVAVIVAAGPAVTRLARNATSTIPIVMAFDTDPVGSGAVASLSRPAGNVTGLSIQATDLAGKQLEILKQIVPRLARIGLITNSQ